MGKKPQRVDALQFNMKTERTKVIEEKLRQEGGVVRCFERWLARRFGLSDRAHDRDKPIQSDLTKMVNAGIITFTTERRRKGIWYEIKLVAESTADAPDSQKQKRRRKV